MKSLITAAALSLLLVQGCAELKEQFSNTSAAAGASSSQPADSNKPGSPNSPYPYNSPWGN